MNRVSAKNQSDLHPDNPSGFKPSPSVIHRGNPFIIILCMLLVFILSSSYQNSRRALDRLETDFLIPQLKQGLRTAMQDTGVSNPAVFKVLPSLYHYNEVRAFYESRDYNPAWTCFNTLHSRATTVWELLENARYFGLQPELYHLARLRSLLSQLEQSGAAGHRNLRMQLELLMTDAVYSFMLNLCAGYQSIDNEVSQGIRESILGALQQGIETGNLQTAILSVQPSFVEYTRLQQATRRFVEKSDLEGNWPDVADPRKDSVLFEKQLKQILLRMDYIEAGADRVSVSEGLKRFQHFHGLQADGRPGKNTVDALRMPALLRYKMLALNLDRLRKQENGCSHLIYVNIPSFTLKVFHNNTFKDAYRVIVGKPDSPTPKLVSSIDRIIANPVWYVPSSITMKEIIPKIQSDTTYLERNGFRFIDRHNQAVNDEDIDFSDLSSTGFNYTLRQEAGSDNALGKIKFVFSNPYSVYMHDTPGKGLFSKDLRAFSHGCIRLEDPRKLADYLVRTLQADTAGIKDAMDRGEYREITLSSPIPIHISYITCVADDSLNLYFYKDIYGYDQQEMSDMEALLTQNMSDILAIR